MLPSIVLGQRLRQDAGEGLTPYRFLVSVFGTVGMCLRHLGIMLVAFFSVHSWIVGLLYTKSARHCGCDDMVLSLARRG